MNESVPRRKMILDGPVCSNLNDFTLSKKESLESWILNHPESLLTIQKEYVKAGANVLLTPTSTTNPAVLSRYNLQDSCELLNQELALLTRNACDEKTLVAGTISTTELSLQPYGETSFTELISCYKRQVYALAPYVDIFFIESIPSLPEMRAAVLTCKRREKDIFVSVSIDENGKTPNNGTDVLAALVTLQEMGISAFGISATNTNIIKKFLPDLQSLAKIPLFVQVSAIDHKLSPHSIQQWQHDIKDLYASGITILGGSINTTPSHIQILSDIIQSDFLHTKPPIEPVDTSFVFSNETQIFYLQPETTEISPPIRCSADMEEILKEYTEQSYDVLLVIIDTPDDAIDFSKNHHMVTLPVMFHPKDEISAKTAFMLYHGRALVDSSCGLDKEQMQVLSKKYGAVIY